MWKVVCLDFGCWYSECCWIEKLFTNFSTNYIQCGSENRPFNIRSHSKSRISEDWIVNSWEVCESHHLAFLLFKIWTFLYWFQIPFKYLTICKSDLFPAFKIRTHPNFRSPLSSVFESNAFKVCMDSSL